MSDKRDEKPPVIFYGVELSGDEVSALLDMTQSAGWAVFSKLRMSDARHEQDLINNPDTDDRERLKHVVAWNTIQNDLLFEEMLRKSIREPAE